MPSSQGCCGSFSAVSIERRHKEHADIFQRGDVVVVCPALVAEKQVGAGADVHKGPVPAVIFRIRIVRLRLVLYQQLDIRPFKARRQLPLLPLPQKG